MKMRSFRPIRRATLRKRHERGSMLLELLVAIIVLAVGIGGLIPLMISSMYNNGKSGNDTSSLMVAEHVLEQISAQPANSAANAYLTITDCAGTQWTVETDGAAPGGGSGGTYGGNGANLVVQNGVGPIIDWTQSYSSVPARYKAQYVSCGNGGRQMIYDVRWDVISMQYLTGNNYTRMVVISARPANSQMVGSYRFIVPVNLRTIGGM